MSRHRRAPVVPPLFDPSRDCGAPHPEMPGVVCHKVRSRPEHEEHAAVVDGRWVEWDRDPWLCKNGCGNPAASDGECWDCPAMPGRAALGAEPTEGGT